MKQHKLTLLQCLRATTKELNKHFASLHPQAVIGEDFVFVPGDLRVPLLVAHADTVHDKLPKKILLDETKGTLTSPTGLGADDRAGVFGILTLWENLDVKPGLLLCDKEETGGLGAYSAAHDLFEELQKYPFYVELDRKGFGECVFYNDEHKEFVQFIESVGFKKEHGLFSDISILGRETKKCSVNLSVGYEKAHTKDEYLVLASLEHTIENALILMLGMLSHPPKDLSLFKLPKPLYQYATSYGRAWDNHGYNWRDDYGFDDVPSVDGYMQRAKHYDLPDKNQRRCECCGIYGETKYTNLTYGYCCASCYQEWLEEVNNFGGGRLDL
jgi:hypothetical protein